MAREAVKGFRMGPLYTPPSLGTPTNRGTLASPAAGGGANWSGAAVDPETGLLYVQSRNTFSVFRLDSPGPDHKGSLRIMEGRGGRTSDATGAAAPEAAVFAHDRDQHEHRRSRVDGAARRRRRARASGC